LIDRLRLLDFRNYESVDVKWSESLNLVVGKNAQGKTNLLEAVFLLSSGRLMRASHDARAVRHGAETATVEGELQSRDVLRVLLKRAGRKGASVNGYPLRRASDLIGRFPTVSFSASDLTLANGEPQDRRQFMDEEMSQIFPAYLRDLTVYKRALAQRNALLRAHAETRLDPELVLPWDERLSESGSALRSSRRAWVHELSPVANEAHARLAGTETLSLSYEANDDANDPDGFRHALRSRLSEDLRRGRTSVGPHLDDLLVSVAGQPIRHFGSQGQQRSAVVSIKLATLDSLQCRIGRPPTLLLDDVFSDLDIDRRDELVRSLVQLGGQTIITCTEESQVSSDLLREAKILRVSSGQVSEQ
jgi:DNA replication and repair protein RecF